MKLEASIVKKMKGFTLDVSFSAVQGEIVGLLGESGGGKSMTLKSIAGILTPDSGRIVLNDHVLFDSERKINVPVRDRNAGYMFQSYALFPYMTVRENICCGIKDRNRKKEIADQFLELLHITPFEGRYPKELSGGQQQRVALARNSISLVQPPHQAVPETVTPPCAFAHRLFPGLLLRCPAPPAPPVSLPPATTQGPEVMARR